MESFIRSKYETRRWAGEGPPPADPSVLDNEADSIAPVPAPVQQNIPTAHQRSRSSNLSSGPIATPALNTRQPAPHRLLSTALADRNQSHVPVMDRTVTSQTALPPPQPKEPENDLFSLDFHAPPASSPVGSASPSETKKDIKNDILSLFSVPPAQAQAPSTFGHFVGATTQQQQSPWDQFGGSTQMQQPQNQVQSTSLMGTNGVGAWGANSGWTAPVVPPAQGNLWGNPTPTSVQVRQPTAFNGGNVWASSAPATMATGNGEELFGVFTSSPASQKKDDAFGDLWGGFK
jgi:stromal membrane-associated protein